MKYALILSLLMCGCAKKPVKADIPKASIPRDCVLGAALDSKGCKPLADGLLKCDGVVIKAACVRVNK